MNFKQLNTELGLNKDIPDEERLRLIETWCSEKISNDLHSSGSTLGERYKYYERLATVYLDDFLPKLPKHLDKPIPEFEGRNTIQEAAVSGLNCFLASLKPSVEMINQPDAATMTPLHLSAIAGHFHTTATLLSLGADASKPNESGESPILSALRMPMLHDDRLKENKTKIFRLLKDAAPATVTSQDSNGDTVLHLMATHGFLALIPELLQTHAELAYVNNKHTHYPIHTAILNNQIDCARLLLKQEGVATLTDSNGWTPLHYAARHGGKNMVAMCCEHTEDLNAPDFLGRTPLMLAVELANQPAIDTLVEKGAHVVSGNQSLR